MSSQRCIGIAGWKNSGKTTLVANLVRGMRDRGYTISTIKHAHHAFDLDQEGTDSFAHRQAGAQEVALVSQNRWAIQHELTGRDEPGFAEILTKLTPCDLVLVEGYKREPIPKLEIMGAEQATQKDWLWPDDDQVIAIACDQEIPECKLPQFARTEVDAICEFLISTLELRKK